MLRRSSAIVRRDAPLLLLHRRHLSSSSFGRHLQRLAWPERHQLGAGIVLLAGSSSISIAFPKISGAVMDSCLAGGIEGWDPYSAAGALCILVGAQSAMVATRGRLMASAGERIAARLRRETFTSLLLKHDAAYFDRNRSGELQSRLTSDCSSLQKIITQDAIGALRGGLMCAGSSVAMLSLSPVLFGVSIATFPAAVLVARHNGERMRERQREVQDALALAGAEADRALGNVRTLKLFAAEEVAIERYRSQVDAARAQAEEVGRVGALSEAGVSFALQASMLCVLAVGGNQVLQGALSYGDLSAFLLYSMMTGFSAGSVASAYAEVRRAAGASERVLGLLEPRQEDRECDGTVTLPLTRQTTSATTPTAAFTAAAAPPGQIDLEGVVFAYPSSPSQSILQGLTLRIDAGERVALTGPSGCGKSTVISLLAGLYPPQAGRVCIGGVDVGELDRRHLRTELLSIVPQEPALFSGSLRDNLAIGKPHATEAELWAAAEAAGCADFAEALWQRDVGERGLQLSGGQKQRVAIARALLRDTPIVVLDEASSALDQALERRVIASLDKALAGKTLVVITHRPAALGLVERVVELPSRVPMDGDGQDERDLLHEHEVEVAGRTSQSLAL